MGLKAKCGVFKSVASIQTVGGRAAEEAVENNSSDSIRGPSLSSSNGPAPGACLGGAVIEIKDICIRTDVRHTLADRRCLERREVGVHNRGYCNEAVASSDVKAH